MRYPYLLLVSAAFLSCVPTGQVFEVEHPRYAKATPGFSTYEAVYDGVRVTLHLSEDRPGVLRLSMGLKNLRDTRITYDFSGISMAGDGQEYTPTWYSGGCCKKSQGYICGLERGDHAFCTIIFGGNKKTACQHVDMQLGRVIVGADGTPIQLDSVSAARSSSN
jgi:hypothetical protein